MVLRRRVRVLTSDELKGLDILQRHAVAQRQPIVSSPRLVEKRGRPVVVDRLRRVCIEGSRINVRSIRSFGRKRVEDAFNDRARCRIVRSRDALGERRHQNIAVDLTPHFSLAGIDTQSGPFP